MRCPRSRPAAAAAPATRSGAASSRALVLEQAPLGLEPAAVPREAPVRADHAAARNDDRDGIGGVGRPRGARRPGTPDTRRELAVRDGLPEADALELAPHALLER